MVLIKEKQSPQNDTAAPHLKIIEGKKAFNQLLNANAELPNYSHGLEAIYSLKEVDASTIRPIQEAQLTEESESLQRHASSINPHSGQYDLNLGAAILEKMPSIALDEPIWVLGLSHHTENCLMKSGRKTVSDIYNIESKELLYIKGMGHGHMEEVKAKLKEFLKKHDMEYQSSIDFSSLLRIISRGIDRKKLHAFFKEYRLHESFSLPSEQKIGYQSNACDFSAKEKECLEKELQNPQRKEYVYQTVSQIVEAFVVPWVRRRFGLAFGSEIQERLLKVSSGSSNVPLILKFIESHYFSNQTLWQNYLIKIDEDVWAIDASYASLFQTIILLTDSYFYHSSCCYTLNELVTLLNRELALTWEGFTDGLLERILRLSTSYRVRKGLDGEIYVRRASWKPSNRKRQASHARQGIPSFDGS